MTSLSNIQSNLFFGRGHVRPTNSSQIDQRLDFTSLQKNSSSQQSNAMVDVENRKRKVIQKEEVEGPNKRPKIAPQEKPEPHQIVEDTHMAEETESPSLFKPKARRFTFIASHILLSQKKFYLGEFFDFVKSIEKIGEDCSQIANDMHANQNAILSFLAQQSQTYAHDFFSSDLFRMSTEIASIKNDLKKAFPQLNIKDGMKIPEFSSYNESFPVAKELFLHLSGELWEVHQVLKLFTHFDRFDENEKVAAEIDRWKVFQPIWKVFSQNYWHFSRDFSGFFKNLEQ